MLKGANLSRGVIKIVGLRGKNIVITGGTGSFGRCAVRRILELDDPASIVVFSRDEMKQWEMAQDFEHDSRIRFEIGDVRDIDRLRLAFRNKDIVIHAAATKIVPTAETNPQECIKTNVIGAMNVIDAASGQGVSKVIALSTDKAVNPVNLYGASKLASDKLFVAANQTIHSESRFSVVRYGNVFGSRGSIVPFFKSIPDDQPTPITDTKMTRFVITLEDGVDLVRLACQQMYGGEIFVRKIPSARILDFAEALRPDKPHTIVGIRSGERVNEIMINLEDARFTYEFENHYVICPAFWSDDDRIAKVAGGKKVADDFVYSSELNESWLSVEDLRLMMGCE